MNPDLKELIHISQRLGSNPFWVQGPGGNTSVKTSDGETIVKSSGSELAQLSENSGYAYCNTAFVNSRLREIWDLSDELSQEIAYSDLIHDSNLYPEKHNRPSMELGIHTLLPFKYVLHFHSPCGLIISHFHESGKRDFNLPETSAWETHWLGFALPGYSLAQQLLEIKIDRDDLNHVFFLKNHGVIVGTNNSPEKAMDNYREWENGFWKATQPDISYDQACNRHELYAYASSHVSDLTPLYPDSIILEKRIANVVKINEQNKCTLDLDQAKQDTGAGDIFAVESLIKNKIHDISRIPETDQGKIRNMPAEIARKKLIKV